MKNQVMSNFCSDLHGPHMSLRARVLSLYHDFQNLTRPTCPKSPFSLRSSPTILPRAQLQLIHDGFYRCQIYSCFCNVYSSFWKILPPDIALLTSFQSFLDPIFSITPTLTILILQLSIPHSYSNTPNASYLFSFEQLCSPSTSLNFRHHQL